MPSVSVIIPSRGRMNQLRSALSSLKNQSLQDWEAQVIIDGDLTRSTTMPSDDKRIHYHFAENCINNPSALRNRGLSFASGDYVAYLDDDDCYDSNHLRKSIETLEESGDFDFLYSGGSFLDRHGRCIYRTPGFHELWDRRLQIVRPYCRTSCIVHRRKGEISWNEKELNIHEDWDFCYRAAKSGENFTSLLPDRTVSFSSGRATRSMAFVRPTRILSFSQFDTLAEARHAADFLNHPSRVIVYQSGGFNDAIDYLKGLAGDAAEKGALRGVREQILQEIVEYYRERLFITLKTIGNKPLIEISKSEEGYHAGILLPPLARSHLEDYVEVHRTIFQRFYRELTTSVRKAGGEAGHLTIRSRRETP